jgi:AcrR family transcriptional regulator
MTAAAVATSGIRGGHATGGRLLTARGLRTRAALVAAARGVFEEAAFVDVKISDITARAGVSSGTFYTYFDSKEELFREVAAAVLAEMSAAPTPDPDNVDRDPIRDIAYATRQFFLACLRNAGVARSIEQVILSDRQVARVRRATLVTGVRRAERWIRRLQAAGICDVEIDPWNTAMALHTMNVRVAYDHLLLADNRDADLEPLVAAVTRIWARTVGLER